MIFSFWLQLTFRQRPLQKVVSTFNMFIFARFFYKILGVSQWMIWYNISFPFFPGVSPQMGRYAVFLLFVSSKIWLSCLFLNKDKDTTKKLCKRKSTWHVCLVCGLMKSTGWSFLEGDLENWCHNGFVDIIFLGEPFGEKVLQDVFFLCVKFHGYDWFSKQLLMCRVEILWPRILDTNKISDEN